MPSAAEVIVGCEVRPFRTFVPFTQLPNDHLCYINSLGYIKLLNSYICMFLEFGKQAVITDHDLVQDNEKEKTNHKKAKIRQDKNN